MNESVKKAKQVVIACKLYALDHDGRFRDLEHHALRASSGALGLSSRSEAVTDGFMIG